MLLGIKDGSRYVSPTVMLRSHTSASIPSLLRAQLDVFMDGEWLELAECGLMAQHLFYEAGLDPAKWSGLALGMGLDRALMLRKGIPDIRLLRSTDMRIEQQMLDLSQWKPVSQMPPVRRDISIVVPADLDAEVLGDRVRTALGNQAEDLESVELLALTSYDELPASVRARLRIRDGQANALIPLVLRPLTRTMTDPQVNQIRDDVYLALHEGPVKELIAG